MAVPSLCVSATTGTSRFIALCRYHVVVFFFKNKLKVCGNPVLSKSTVTISCIFLN